MQDQQSNSFIFNFSKKQLSILKYSLVFFIPVLLVLILLELLVLNIPMNYKSNSNYFYKNKNVIEVMALGSSQMAGAVNPKYIDKPTICLASASQHHKLDFTIIKQLQPSLKNLKYVILELSSSHLELPHNSKNFWKNSVYLKYFNVNAYERKTYFKDKLIYLSNPDIYSKKLVDYYIFNKDKSKLNRFGFDENSYSGIFNSLNYDLVAISNLEIKPNHIENNKTFKENSDFLFSMIEYLNDNNINVIICTLPIYNTHKDELNTNIVKRRDSIISLIQMNYPNVIFLKKESDNASYKVTHFNNHNHLNPDGAKKFTKELNIVINKIE